MRYGPLRKKKDEWEAQKASQNQLENKNKAENKLEKNEPEDRNILGETYEQYKNRKAKEEWTKLQEADAADATYQQFLKYRQENNIHGSILGQVENNNEHQKYEDKTIYQKPEEVKLLFRDSDYEYINDTKWSPKYLGDGNGDATSQERKGYDYITDEERKKYNYIYNSLGKKEAEKYLEELNLTQRMADDVIAKNEEYATAHPVIASAKSVARNVLGGGMGYAESVANKALGKDIDENSYANLINRSSSAIRETVSDNIDSEAGKFFYQTGMSMADSVAAMAATAWTGPLGLAPGTAAGFILGSNAATSAMLNAKERGVTDGQALATGLAQGAAEMFFEKFSLGNLEALKDVPVTSLKSMIGSVLKQAGIEGSEEVFTSIANSLTDLVINRDLAENELNVQNYVNQGYTLEEASVMGAKDQLRNLFMDFLGGAVSGGVMGGGASALNYAMNRNQTTENLQETETENTETETLNEETEEVVPETEETIQNPEEIPWEEAQMYEGEPQNTEVAPAQFTEESTQETTKETETVEPKKLQSARETVETVLQYGTVNDVVASDIAKNKTIKKAFEEKTGVKITGTEEQQKNTVKEVVRVYAETHGSTAQNTPVATSASQNATVKGKGVEIIGVKSLDGSNPKFEALDGKIYSAEEVSFEENANRKLYADASKLAIVAGDETANSFVKNYKSEYNIAAYSWGFDALYKAGRNGVPLQSALKAADYAVQYTDAYVMTKAWELGAKAKKAEDSKVKVEKKQQNRKGKGTFTDETRQGGPVAEIARLVADRTGIDIVRKARLDRDANAAFVPSTMTMLLSENAENEYTSLIHELGEFGLSYNRDDMKQVQEAIIRWWAENNGVKGMEDLDTIIKNYQRVYAKAEGSKTTSQSIDEMINDALGGLFSTDTGVDQFVQWLQKESGYNQTEQRTIIQRVIDMIDNVVKYLKNVIKDSRLSRAARETAQMEEKRANEIRQMFLDVLEGAVENANTTGEYKSDTKIKYSFAGMNASNADKSSLEAAKAMNAKGVSSEEIRQTTGWHRGYDGKWRFEIDDSKMEILNPDSNYMKLDQLLKHDKLFEAYPILREVDVVFQNLDNNYRGNFNRQFFTINLNSKLKNDSDQLQKTLIHEIQHAIQEEEGFANGSNVEYWKTKLEGPFDSRTNEVKEREKELKKRYYDLLETNSEFVLEMEELEKMTPTVPRGQIDWETFEQIEDDPIEWQEFDAERERLEEKYGDDEVFEFLQLKYNLSDLINKGRRSGNELYYDTAGEIEARETTRRMTFNEADRKKYQPRNKYENLKRDNVVFADENVSFSLKGVDEQGIEVYETSGETKKMKYSERKALLLNLMKNEFAGRTAKFNKNGQVYYALYDKEGVRKGVYGDNKSDRKGFNAKVNIGADGNYIELAENARYYGTSREQGKNNKFHRDAKTWDYYVKTIKSDGIYFDVLINVKDTGNDQYVYNVQLNENKAALSHAITHLKSKEAASNNIVSDISENATPETKFSLREDYDALEERYRNTLRENDTYKTVIDALESKLNIQKDISASKDSIEKAVDKLYRRYKSTYDKADFADKVAGLFQSGETNKGNFLYIAEQIMRPVIENSKNNLEISDYAKGILKDIRKTSIKLDGMQRNEAAYHYGTFNDYRKSLFGRVTFSDKGTSLDILWKQWSEAYPEWFDESISPVDQPVKLAEIINNLKEDYSNEYGFNLNDAVSYAAMELMNEYVNLPEVKGMTDKDASAQFKSQYMKLTNAIKKEYQEKYEKQIAELKRENRSKLERQEAKFRATAAKSRGDRLEAQEKKKYKNSIMKNTKEIVRWFEENTDKHHIPEILKDTTMNFLESMDFMSEKGWNSQDTIQLQNRLNILYRKFSSEENNVEGSSIMQDIDPDFLPTMDGLISILEQNKEIKKIGDMDSQQLKEVAYLVGTLKRTISTANKLIGNKQYERVSQIGDSSVSHMAALKAKKKLGKWMGMGDEMLNTHMLDSFSFFEQMGEGAKSIHQEIREGFNKRVWMLEEAKKYMQKNIGDTKIKNWTGKSAELHEFNYNGQEFGLTTGQLMNLYVLSKRPQALQHLMAGGGMQSESGGFTVDTKSIVKGQKVAERRVKISEAQMKEMFEKLTPEQKKMADAMQKFLANNCSEWGNEVSMTLYGYKKFGEKTYWPIKTNDNFNKTDDRNANGSAGDNTSLYAIRNQGMTKNLVKNANNPIVVGDIFDVFSEHVANMANYNAFVVPLSDAMKWYNYRSRTNEGNVSGSIKEEMERAFGISAKKYFITFMKDVNGEINKGVASEISNTFTSKYKASAVGANIRTVVQQPTSYLRAASVMNPKYLAAGFSKLPAIKEMQENSAIAIWKSWGYFETGLGQSMKQVLTGEGTAIEKIVELSMWGTGKADDLTWGMLWNAVKAEIADKNKNIDTSSEEYMKLVSQRFDKVIDQTQVVDTVLHRSQIMRSQNGVVKMATAFMSEPTKSYNLLHSAVRNTMEHNTTKNRAEVARRATVYALTGIATAAAASLVDVFRDDDEEKEWSEKYLENLWANVKDNINPMNMIPYLKEIPSLWEGYDSSRMDMAGISNLVTSVQQAIKFAQGDSTKNLYGVSKGIIRALSQVIGVPMYNALRDTEALVEQITDTPIDEKELTNATVRIRLLKYMHDGNDKKLKKYLAWYDKKYQEKISDGKTDKDARKDLKSSITSQFKEIYQNSSNADKIKIKQLLLKISVGGKQLYKDYDWSSWDEKK